MRWCSKAVNRSCFLSLAALAHAAQPLGHARSRSVSGACVAERRSPSVCALPSPASAEASLLCSSGSQVLWRSPTPPTRACPVVRSFAFPDRPARRQGALEVSRFSCILFLSVRGLFDYAGPAATRDLTRLAVLPSPLDERSRHPDCDVFEAQSPRPPMPLSTLRCDTSRCPTQDSRPGWIRYFLSCRALASPTTCRFIPALSE